MTDTEKDITAIDIGIKAIERNNAAIDECKKQIASSESIVEELYGEEGAYQHGRIDVLYNILEILEGKQ